MSDEPIFFDSPADLRAWLETNHDSADELVVGYRKKATGLPSVTWEESRDEALCFGWIDGIRRGRDERTYTIRFTPRRPGSTWSRVNVERFAALEAEGRVTDAGRAAFARRSGEPVSAYSYEREGELALPTEYERELRRDPAAAEFFDAQPPGYRGAAIQWVTSAKREETRRRRLATLIADSARGQRIKPLRR